METNFVVKSTNNSISSIEVSNAVKKVVNKSLDVAKYFSIGIGLTILQFNTARAINYSGFCFSDQIPLSWHRVAEKIVPLYYSIYDTLPGGCPLREFSGGNLFDTCIKGPICEELFYRFAFQEALLKQLPKKLLLKYSPQNVSLVNCKAAQVARILLSSTLFTLVHLSYQQNCIGLNQVFIAGLTYGFLQEKTGTPFASIGMHVAANCLGNMISGSDHRR